MRRTLLSFSALLTASGLALAGCQPSGPPRGHVRGKVTVDGEPVRSGAILFTPAKGVEGAPIQFKITDGTYASSDLGAVVGTNSVAVSGVKPSGKQVRNFATGELTEDYVEIVPPKYNEHTTLTVGVKEGDNTFDFDLEGKPQKQPRP